MEVSQNSRRCVPALSNAVWNNASATDLNPVTDGMDTWTNREGNSMRVVFAAVAALLLASCTYPYAEGRRSGGFCADDLRERLPVPREKRGEIGHRMVADAGEHVGEPRERIHAVQLCGVDE